MSVDANGEPGFLTENSMYITRQMPSYSSVHISMSLSPVFPASCFTSAVRIAHVGDDADLGVSLRHLRMLIPGYFWHYPTWALCVTPLKAVTDADQDLSEQSILGTCQLVGVAPLLFQ